MVTHRNDPVKPRLHLDELLSEKSPVLDLADRFREAGRRLFLVGGPVRDSFLKRDVSDLDFATDAPPEETLAIVKPVAEHLWLQGQRFGTVGARISDIPLEITTFRHEKYEEGSRHPEVAFTSDIDSDLARRDFTINAMAIELPGKSAIDPFGGVEDLRRKVIRTPVAPEVSFSDDPLRMLRAFRFAAQLEFRIHEDTLNAIADMKDQIKSVSAERIRDELSRLLIGNAPGEVLEVAESTGLTEIFLPELSALKLEQDPVHRHKDVFHHTLAVVDRTQPELTLRLAALLHDVGKPKTRQIGPDGVSFHHHEIKGAQMAEKRLRALRFPNAVVNDVTEVIRLHHRFHTYRLGWTDSAVRRYVRDAGSLLGTLNALVRADCTTRNKSKAEQLAKRMDELEARIAELAKQEELDKIRPELNGDEVMELLGVGPGPVVGRALKFLLDLRLDEGEVGRDEAFRRLQAWAREQGIEPEEGGS